MLRNLPAPVPVAPAAPIAPAVAPAPAPAVGSMFGSFFSLECGCLAQRNRFGCGFCGSTLVEG